MKDIEITDEEWHVVEERAKELPTGFYIGIIGKTLSKEELLEAIQKRNECGQAYAKMQIEVMKWCVKQALTTS